MKKLIEKTKHVIDSRLPSLDLFTTFKVYIKHLFIYLLYIVSLFLVNKTKIRRFPQK